MDFRQMEIFLDVMQYSSVTRAAEHLFLSPGSASMQLHNLSAELHTDLFMRSGRRIIPTQQAFRLADQAREVLNKIREIHQNFDAIPERDSKSLRFATGATTLIHGLDRSSPEVNAESLYFQASVG